MKHQSKSRQLTNYRKLSKAQRQMLAEQYPFGIAEEDIQQRKRDGKRIYAIMLETDDATIMVSIDLRDPMVQELIHGSSYPDDNIFDPEFEDEAYSDPDDPPMAA